MSQSPASEPSSQTDQTEPPETATPETATPETATRESEQPATAPKPAPAESRESHHADHAADRVTPAPDGTGGTDDRAIGARPAVADGDIPQEPTDAAPDQDGGPSEDTGATADAEAQKAPQAGAKKKRKKKPKSESNQPTPAQIVKRIGTTTEQAMAYVAKPDPQLSRLSRKVYEALLPDLPPVVAGALLGPAALTRHLIASAAAGRYRDLFFLWEVFRAHPDQAKPEISERQVALEKGQRKLEAATRIGLLGRHPELVAADVARAQGLIWQWLRDVLAEKPELVGRRPAIASALLEREPDFEVPLPSHPDETWLAEAASARVHAELAAPVDRILSENAHRLPATLETLRLATRHYPERVAALIDRVELDSPDIGAFLAWARDHEASDRLHGRIREQVSGAAARDLSEGLARWHHWVRRGVSVELPTPLRSADIGSFDLTKPETAALARRLTDAGQDLNLQSRLDGIAAEHTQRGEKAYEALVCEDLPVELPHALEGNPAVKEGTRCPKCLAWTWVRPGHEQRCPRPEAPEPTPTLSAFELAAAESSGSPGSL